MAEAATTDHYNEFLKSIGVVTDDKSALNAYKFNAGGTANKRSAFTTSK